MTSRRDTTTGLWIAAASFVAWGLMPLYWHLLKAVPSLQIVLHRIAWSAVFVCGWLLLRQGTGWLRGVLAQPRLAAMLAASGMLIAFNWGLYIWAVNDGHVVETSLGYFINPLLNVVIGVLFLRERLSLPQWLSVGIAATGVLWLTFNYGSFPWIALALAGSFALYGVIRKLAAVDSVVGLGVESAYLFLPTLAWLLWNESHGAGGFGAGYGVWLSALLVASGVLTALPLVGFSFAVRRIPLSTVGLMQYIAPTLQFLIGVFAFHEPFDRNRAIGFVFIWVALAIFASDGLLRARRSAAAAAT
jgi:chloramphenicol-sensitive protein RarD